MNVDILTMHDNNFAIIANITVPNKEEYCRRHSYRLVVDTKRQEGQEWNKYKMSIIIDQLQNSDCDWLAWIDCDALIMNMKTKLESFIDDSYEFIIGEDWNGINSGVMFLKRCDNTIDFMRRCMAYEPTELDRTTTPYWWWPSEQCAYTRLIKTIKSKVVHHSLFNGYVITPDPNNDWRHQNIGVEGFPVKDFELGDFIIHFVSGNIAFKLPSLVYWNARVIR